MTWILCARSRVASLYCTRGASSPRGTWTRFKKTRRSLKSIWGPERADSQSGESILWGQSYALGCGSLDPRRITHLLDGPQRHGKDDPSEMHHGPIAGEFGQHHLRGNGPAKA